MKEINTQMFILVMISILKVSTVLAQQTPQVEFVSISPANYRMGGIPGVRTQQDEFPVRNITLSAFKVSKTEITVAQFQQFCTETKRKFPPQPTTGNNANLPVVNVTWNEAVAYAKWLSKRLDVFVRLPTEAEWEYMAGAGWLGDATGYGYEYYENFKFSQTGRVLPVGSKKPNKLGIHDINGNVSEWCNDTYGAYQANDLKDPKGFQYGTQRVVRGGNWNDPFSSLAVSARKKMSPIERSEYVGFRVIISSRQELRDDPEYLVCEGAADFRIKGFQCSQLTSFEEELLRYAGYDCSDYLSSDAKRTDALVKIWRDYYTCIQCDRDTGYVLAIPESGMLGRAIYGYFEMFWALVKQGFFPDFNALDKNGDTIIDWIDKQMDEPHITPSFKAYLIKIQLNLMGLGAKRAMDL